MLKSRLPEIAIEIEVIVEEALDDGAEMVAQRARVRVEPHRATGRLEEAIHTDDEPEGVYVVAGGGSEDVFWGHMLEHGTTHSPPYPFLVPALDESRDDVRGLVRDRLRRIQ